MKLHKAQVDEVEAERLQLMDELSSEFDPKELAAYRPGSFGCHELLDRTGLLAGVVEEELLTHPACIQNPEWFALASKAVAALNELYQKVGAEHLSVGEVPPVQARPSKAKRKAQ